MSPSLFHFSFKALALLPGLCSLLLLPACEDEAGAAPASPPARAEARPLVSTAAFSGENAYSHCAALCALGPRLSGSAAYTAQLAYLEQHLKAAGWQVRREEFAPLPGMRMVNLHAWWGESAPDGENTRPLLISCHIDTKAGIPGFIGADDGASAAAAMLEAARILAAQHPEQAARVELVFLDGEEAFGKRMNEQDGMYGSKYDVARRKGHLPRWQVNLDMVGGRDMLIAVPLLDTSDAMMAQYERAVSTLGLSPDRWSACPGTYLDDHLPYLHAGVDSLNLIAWFQSGGWWHTTRDNMSRISARSLEESGRMLLQLCQQLLGEAP